MKISYNWLQNYFDDKLPVPEKLAELITFSFAEVEGIEKRGEDIILDVKVLPDRACYALSHRGVAYEAAAVLNIKKKEMRWPLPVVSQVAELSVRVEAPDLCPRYMARVIENINTKEQAWVTEHLEAVGQRSIHPVVDGANVVMLDMGQPLHAFDRDMVDGEITVRLARPSEKITTLDNKEVLLDETMLVISDDKSVLAVAGVKGGKKAEVTSRTKNLILESANFNAESVRRTSEKLGIKTDASKRFENGLSPESAARGMEDFTAYIFEMDKNIKVGEVADVYSAKKDKTVIETTGKFINDKLGANIANDDIKDILTRLSIEAEEEGGKFTIFPPYFRLDLRVEEDIVEEIGRIYGYSNVGAREPRSGLGVKPAVNKKFYYENFIRQFMVERGFSEVMNSTFRAKGKREIVKPLAKDKAFLREELSERLEKCLDNNCSNAALLGLDEVKIFEIGNVFPEEGEHTSFCVGIRNINKKDIRSNDKIKAIRDDLIAALGVSVKVVCTVDDSGGQILNENKMIGKINNLDGIMEIDLDELILPISAPNSYNGIIIDQKNITHFKPYSVYPFVVRDIALWAPADSEKDIEELLRKEAGHYAVSVRMFDSFVKDGRTSFALRIVFQSKDKTLTDNEVNNIMEKIYKEVASRGWEVR